MRIFYVVIFLMLAHVGMSQSGFSLCRNDITNYEENKISQQLKQLEYYHWHISNYYISWFQCEDLKSFLKRMIVNDENIECITLKNSVLTINYRPEFYRFQIMIEVYMQYNDKYRTLFSYDEIEAISIVLTDGYNVTFLPTISSDYWFTVENAIMKKEWFVDNIDYVSLMGMKIAEDDNSFNKKSELRSTVLNRLIKEYKALINPIAQMSRDIFSLCRSDISNTEEKYISQQLKKIKTYHTHTCDFCISWFQCDNLELFLKRIIVNDIHIECITLIDSILTVSYHPDFLQFRAMNEQPMGDIYYQYNDMYNALFSFSEIKAVSIVMTNGTNATFLPTPSPDNWFTIENAIMKKEWFIYNINYVRLMGMKIVEDRNNFNEKDEFRTNTLELLIKKYKTLTSSNDQT